jgi:hypothetical protein
MWWGEVLERAADAVSFFLASSIWFASSPICRAVVI